MKYTCAINSIRSWIASIIKPEPKTLRQILLAVDARVHNPIARTISARAGYLLPIEANFPNSHYSTIWRRGECCELTAKGAEYTMSSRVLAKFCEASLVCGSDPNDRNLLALRPDYQR